MPSRKSTLVTEKLFQEIPPEPRKSFTCDKVNEFCGHQELSQKLGADSYDCYSLSFLGKRIK
jgi:IS30 family transposase